MTKPRHDLSHAITIIPYSSRSTHQLVSLSKFYSRASDENHFPPQLARSRVSWFTTAIWERRRQRATTKCVQSSAQFRQFASAINPRARRAGHISECRALGWLPNYHPGTFIIKSGSRNCAAISRLGCGVVGVGGRRSRISLNRREFFWLCGGAERLQRRISPDVAIKGGRRRVLWPPYIVWVGDWVCVL